MKQESSPTNKDITFLIPAHNEEKTVCFALDNLMKIDYPQAEIIVCLDGCTDRTKEIVQQYENVKIVENERKLGKIATIQKAFSLCTGNIIVVHDSDWILHFEKGGIKKLVNCFDDPQIGGLHFPNHFPFLDSAEGVKKIRDFAFLGRVWWAKFMHDYQIKHQTKRIGDILYVDEEKMNFPFLINIFRKDLIGELKTTHDDAEFALHILQQDYRIRIIDRTFPYFVNRDNAGKTKDIFKKKTKGRIGWRQIKKTYNHSFSTLYPKIFFYGVINSFRTKTIKSFFAVYYYIILTAVHVLFFNLKYLFRKEPSVEEAWGFLTERYMQDS